MIRTRCHPGRSFANSSIRRQREFEERDLETFDQPCHEQEIEGIDRVAGEVVVWIPKKGRVRYHQGRKACVPERGVITQACLRQNPSVERQKK